MEPEVIRDKEAMRRWSRAMRSQGKTIGLVPTMGYLHDGHLSLVRQSLTLADVTVVSIYVNPGQFSPTEDLSTYPSDFSGDLVKLAALSGGKVVVFNPRNLYDYGGGERKKVNNGGGGRVVSCVEEGGGLGHETWIRVERLEKGLCGKSRPVFFRGVATIVTKLFNIVEPDVAVFGKKDYQQWRIIQRMALSISRSLAMAKASVAKGQTSCTELKGMIIQQLVGSDGRVDYVEIVDQETLEGVEEIKSGVVICVAAWFGTVRLIDNIEIDISL
ncbi:PREDICTED: pantoate--beta-alanine ligase-like isoform X2 [Camelina sativa]|uniref:Pantoate--beta-alanine ligase n=1 Tax=Camelina sativa TaxID=90675 RepID=A0ABM0UDW8_CAMSA|nr:PREDICTED: pantoate--beta-alanine ligase-like isoform X2 [Camelina sativa]